MTATSPETIAEYAQRIAAEAPPLTPEQFDRVRVLLTPSAKQGKAA